MLDEMGEHLEQGASILAIEVLLIFFCLAIYFLN